MVNARLCKTGRLAFFFASPRHFDFLDCEIETLKCSERDRDTFRRLKFEPQIWLRAMRRMNLYKSKPSYEKSVKSQYPLEIYLFCMILSEVSNK